MSELLKKPELLKKSSTQQRADHFIKDCLPQRACEDQSELVSVFVVCKDRVKTIRRCLESILNQSYKNIEIVVQDGASTDGTLEVLREYEQKLEGKMKLVSEPDGGPEDAFWRVLKRCKGKYITSCMTDEELLPDTVALGVDFMRQNPTAAAMTGDIFLTDLEGSVERRIIGNELDLIDYGAGKIGINFAGAMFRQQALVGVGLFDYDWNMECGEFELWIRLGMAHPVAYLPVVLAKYAEHRTQSSLNPRFIFRYVKSRFEILRGLFERAQPPFVGDDLERACLFFTAEQNVETLFRGKFFREQKKLLEYCVELRPELGEWLNIPPSANQFLTAAEQKMDEGETEEASKILLTGARLHKDDPRLLHEQACLLFREGKLNQSLSISKKVEKICPAFLTTYCHTAMTYEHFGEIEKSLEYWRKTFPLQDPHTHSYYLHSSLRSLKSTPESLLKDHLHWAERYGNTLQYKLGYDWRKGVEDRVITIGYHSSYWPHPAMKYPVLPLLKHHDRSRFRVIGYNEGVRFTESSNQHYKPEFVDEMRNTAHLSDEQFVDLVRSDGVDIFVEICGHSGRHRFVSMTGRCAPVQVSYTNYVGTCGVPNVDYVIADDHCVSKEEERYYTETVYRLPGSVMCFNYDDEELPEPGPSPVAQEEHPTFSCFACSGKINHLMIQLWSQILKRLPGARIMLCNIELGSRDVRDRFLQKFVEHGVPADRVILYAACDWRTMMKLYREIDIAFDTFPYNGANSVAEPLWQGVPVVTLKGDRFASAYGASHILAAGCPELIAYSSEEYVEKAVELAQDVDRLKFYRKNLRRMTYENGLTDVKKFIQKLEAAYLDMLSNVTRHA